MAQKESAPIYLTMTLPNWAVKPPKINSFSRKDYRPEILLHPNIPKPLHGVNPRTIKGDSWWAKQREQAYASTDYHCAACGVSASEAKEHKWLEAHELYDFDYAKGRMTFKETVPLCHYCHNYIHSGRMRMLVDKGEMLESKQLAITLHGNALIQKAGLKRPSPPKTCAQWSVWRLSLDGKLYKPIFASFDKWAAHYCPGTSLSFIPIDQGQDDYYD